MIAEDNWKFKKTITQRTRLTTLAIALQGRDVLTWIITAGVVGIFVSVLVLQVLVLLNYQSPLPTINWRVTNMIAVDN